MLKARKKFIELSDNHSSRNIDGKIIKCHYDCKCTWCQLKFLLYDIEDIVKEAIDRDEYVLTEDRINKIYERE